MVVRFTKVECMGDEGEVRNAAVTRMMDENVRKSNLTWIHIFTVRILPAQAWSGPKGSRRATCTAWSSGFSHSLHTVGRYDVGSPRVLFCSTKGVNRVDTGVESGGLEACETKEGTHWIYVGQARAVLCSLMALVFVFVSVSEGMHILTLSAEHA